MIADAHLLFPLKMEAKEGTSGGDSALKVTDQNHKRRSFLMFDVPGWLLLFFFYLHLQASGLFHKPIAK